MTAKCPSCGYALAKCAAGGHAAYAERHRLAAIRYQERKVSAGKCTQCGKGRPNLYKDKCDSCGVANMERQRAAHGWQSTKLRYPQRKRHKAKGESE